MKPILLSTTARDGPTRITRGLALASADPLHLNHHSDLKFQTQDDYSAHSGNDGHSSNHTEDFDSAWFSSTGSWGFGDNADSNRDFNAWNDGGSNGGDGHHGSFFANFAGVGADCTDTPGGPGPVSVPDGSSTMVLLGSGLAMLLAFGRRFFSPL
jgi:hypothetical protein